MIYISINRLASEVATLLGESLSPECDPTESPFPDLEDRVRILAPLILAELLQKAEISELSGSKPINSVVSREEDETGRMPLPDDFLRLGFLKLKGWRKGIYEISLPGSKEFYFQSSLWAGVRGTSERPIAIMSQDKDGKRILKLFPCDTNDVIETATYYGRPQINPDDTLEIAPALYGALLKELKESFISEQ